MELKPCPFCGGEAVIRWDYQSGAYEINCSGCNGTFTHWYYEFDEQVEAWNRRVNNG